MGQIRMTRFLDVRLRELGVDMPRLLARAGLPEQFFAQSRIVLSTAQSFAFWRALEALNPDPALGLKIGDTRHDRLELADPSTIVALSAASFRDALTRLARYKRLFCSEEMRLIQEGDLVSLDAIWHAASEPTPPLLTDAMFSAWLALGRYGTGQPLRPQSVCFRRQAPARAQIRLYEAHFGTEVSFNAGADRLILAAEQLELPFRSHNPELQAALVPGLEAELQRLPAGNSESGRVIGLLRSRLAGQTPTIQSLAAELHLSPRTLQRRLAEEGSSFQHLLEQVRRELARDYLERPDFDLAEVAYLLGYEETSSFHRAFQHWEGTTPGQWRAAQARLLEV